MHFITKKAMAVMLILVMLALDVCCVAKTARQKVDFSGVWEGSLTVEGMRMPGKMILELDSKGKGSARFGFDDELTEESIPVELNKENGLKGEGTADQMHFDLEGKFYEMDEEWVFAGNLIINDGYEINDTTVEFFREGSELIPDLSGEIGYPEEMLPEAWDNSIDFDGEWTGNLFVEDMSMPGKMILELDSSGKGSARIGFGDELTQESIPVELNKKNDFNSLKGEGTADQMHFDFEGWFYELDDRWLFVGNMIIIDGYEVYNTTFQFYRWSEEIADLMGEIGYPEDMSPEAWDNSIDFSGEWTGIQLIAEVSGADAQKYKYMEGLKTGCLLVLSVPNYGTGWAELQFGDDLAWPELTAYAAYDRLELDGLLWGDPFESSRTFEYDKFFYFGWSGTFEYDKTAEEWTLTGGGDITDPNVDVTFHIVLSLNKASADAPEQQPQAPAPNNQGADINAPLNKFLIGVWMGPPSNVMVERQVLYFFNDGTTQICYATPGPGATEENFFGVGTPWKLDDPVSGKWRVEGKKLIAKFEIDSISFETDVRVIDADSIEIEVFYTRKIFRRLPGS